MVYLSTMVTRVPIEVSGFPWDTLSSLVGLLRRVVLGYNTEFFYFSITLYGALDER